MSQEWTTTPPTEPGWYWVNSHRIYKYGKVEIVRLQHMDDYRFPNNYGVYPTGRGPYRSWDEIKATHWLGPLPEPAHPGAIDKHG